MQLLSCQVTNIPSFDGEKLYSVAQGNLTNPSKTFIFHSGLGGGVNSWVWVVETVLQINPTVRCITFDMRGHSKSSHRFPKVESDFLSVLSLDFAAICNFYDCKQPIFVGHSLGGIVIQTYLDAQLTPKPNRVVFICVPLELTLFPLFMGKLGYFLLSHFSSISKQTFPSMSVDIHFRLKNSFDFSVQRIFNDIKTTGFVQFLLYWICILSWRAVPVSVLKKNRPFLVFGALDLLLTKTQQHKIKNTLPDSHTTLLPTNHNAVVNAPEKIAEVLTSI